VLAVLALVTSLLPGPFGELLPLLLAAGAAAAAVAGVRGLGTRLATPDEVRFRGHVIARWIERRGDNDSDWDASCIAVDDGPPAPHRRRRWASTLQLCHLFTCC
jgi:hypothetical protein